MTDVMNATQRSFCMSRISGRNTTPELALRRSIWAIGFRYRVHTRLAGRPDIVFTRERVAIFVDGCFWHGCPKHYKAPAANAAFWRKKKRTNSERDRVVNSTLASDGWKVLRFWEHEVEQSLEAVVSVIQRCLKARGIRRPSGASRSHAEVVAHSRRAGA